MRFLLKKAPDNFIKSVNDEISSILNRHFDNYYPDYGYEEDMDKLSMPVEVTDKDKEYDRLGMEEEYTEFLGNKVVCHSLPIRPGRNLAVICETAAVNHRQKKMGYNAAQELYRRVQENLTKAQSDDEEDE